MNKSIFLARVIGIFLLVMSLSLFVNKELFMPAFTTFFNMVAWQFILGMILLIVGTLLVVSHNIWEASWVIVVTIIAWLVFIKGILYLIFPEFIQSIAQEYLGNENWIYAGGIVNLIIALFLCYKGFIITKVRGKRG